MISRSLLVSNISLLLVAFSGCGSMYKQPVTAYQILADKTCSANNVLTRICEKEVCENEWHALKDMLLGQYQYFCIQLLLARESNQKSFTFSEESKALEALSNSLPELKKVWLNKLRNSGHDYHPYISHDLQLREQIKEHEESIETDPNQEAVLKKAIAGCQALRRWSILIQEHSPDQDAVGYWQFHEQATAARITLFQSDLRRIEQGEDLHPLHLDAIQQIGVSSRNYTQCQSERLFPS